MALSGPMNSINKINQWLTCREMDIVEGSMLDVFICMQKSYDKNQKNASGHECLGINPRIGMCVAPQIRSVGCVVSAIENWKKNLT
jgi:hypothetical protein